MNAAAGVPGVLMALGDERSGVLLRGAAGSGKSALALALLDRGHALVADDLVLLDGDDPARPLTGRAADRDAPFLCSRELGVIDVARLFGSAALCARCALRLLIDLEPQTPPQRDAGADPLSGRWRRTRLLGRTLPLLELGAAAAADRALWVECALREQTLRDRGYSARDELIARQRLRLERETARCG